MASKKEISIIKRKRDEKEQEGIEEKDQLKLQKEKYEKINNELRRLNFEYEGQKLLLN